MTRLHLLLYALFSLFLQSNTMATAPIDDRDTEWGRVVEEKQPERKRVCPSGAEPDEFVEIAIIGGGLVGLAVALGLQQRNIGPFKIYERAPQLRSQSQGILSLQPNGQRALEELHPDILPRVKERGCERLYLRRTNYNEQGSVVDDATAPSGDNKFVATYGRRKVGMTWHNMQLVLSSLLPEHLIETNRSLQQFQEHDDHTLLYFDNGSVVKAKVIIACDGVFSVARRQLYDEDSPIYFGQLNWATIIETTKLPPNVYAPHTVRYLSYAGEPRWMSMLNDGGSGWTFWQLRIADQKKAMALSGNKGRGGLGLPGVKNTLLSMIEHTIDNSSDLYQAVQAIPEEQIFERAIVGRTRLTNWLSPGGRLVLVGDAAHGMHPNIGQGANQGFESAYAVVQMLDQHDDYKVALEEFQRIRKPRADLVQTFANAMGILQATGQEMLSQEAMQEMMHWILLNDPTLEPPADVVDLLGTFDPFEQPGVSPLW